MIIDLNTLSDEAKFENCFCEDDNLQFPTDLVWLHVPHGDRSARHTLEIVDAPGKRLHVLCQTGSLRVERIGDNVIELEFGP